MLTSKSCHATKLCSCLINISSDTITYYPITTRKQLSKLGCLIDHLRFNMTVRLILSCVQHERLSIIIHIIWSLLAEIEEKGPLHSNVSLEVPNNIAIAIQIKVKCIMEHCNFLEGGFELQVKAFVGVGWHDLC